MLPKKDIILVVAAIVTLTKICDSAEISSLADLPNIRVVCYYASWAAARTGIGKFTPENINPYLCTHLNYAFGGLTKEITFIPSNENLDIEQGGYAKFTELKSYNKDLKTMLTLGGWNEGSVRFASIAANSSKRSILVKNSIDFLRKHNFDGLDLDWQFPFLKDRRTYASLIQELREGYETESQETSRPRLLLTITLPTLNDHITKGYDVPQLTKYVDWMNVLNYNYHNEFEPLVNHHSQLFSVDENSDYELNADYTITSYLESGAERSKLVLGIPTYGRAYNLSDPTMTDIGSPAAGPGIKGDQTMASGFLAYYEICRNIKDDGWIVEHPYPNAMGPYAYKDNQWVGYDDENIMKKKSQYVAENKLGGIMFWVLDYDDFHGYCTGKEFPLIEAAKEALITASGYILERAKTRRPTTTTVAPEKEDKNDSTLMETTREQQAFDEDTKSVGMRSRPRTTRRRGRTTTKLPVNILYSTPKPPPTPSYEPMSMINKIISPVYISLRAQQVLPENFSASNLAQNEDRMEDLIEVNKNVYEKNSENNLPNIRVVCYYASWAAARAGIGKFTPENIDPFLCTHINYAFGGITKEITFIPSNENLDIEQGGYAKFTGLKSLNKNLKTMLALGGWNEGSVKFASIAENSTKRSILVKNSIDFLRKHNFDGLNLDWQYPYLKDRRTYASLIQELREGYENESKETGRPRLLLTITVPLLKDHITRGYDVPQLTKYVDWMNVLSYDYHREIELLVNHHSQLFSVDESSDYELNANYTITSYLESGAESSKLVLGIPTYGRAYNLSDPNMTDIGSLAAGPGIKGDQTNESGFLAYYEICRKIKDDGWIVKQPYPNAMGPYAYKGNQWVSYDDENIMKKKAQYVAENKLGGIMFWVMEYDDFHGYCTGKKFPLIEAAKEALITASGYILEKAKTRRPTTTKVAPEKVDENNSTLMQTSRDLKAFYEDTKSVGMRSRQRTTTRKGTTTTTLPVNIQYSTPNPPPTPSYEPMSGRNEDRTEDLLEVSKSVNEKDSENNLPNIRVVCYYASWAAARAGIGKFTPKNIDPFLCTHINYAFGGITKEITFIPSNENLDIEQGGYANFTGLKSYNKNLKTMLTLGGWNEGSVRFASIANDSTTRSILVHNSIDFLRKHNFDGLDLDWQFPGLKDRQAYASLIQELREGYENESKETGRPRLLLTITLPILKDHITRGYDVPQLTKYVDWMNLVTYNYHNEFELLANHHSPLFSVDKSSDYELNANYTVTSYLEAGAESSKLVLGIPTYGRTFNLNDPTMKDIGSPAAGPGIAGDQTMASGFLAYYEICRKIKDEGWIVEQPYPNAMGPYAYKDNQWVGFDDENIVKRKSQYVAETKLGGIMFWVLDYDDFHGYCNGKRFPLIEAAKEALSSATLDGSSTLSEPTAIKLIVPHGGALQQSTIRPYEMMPSVTETTNSVPTSSTNPRDLIKISYDPSTIQDSGDSHNDTVEVTRVNLEEIFKDPAFIKEFQKFVTTGGFSRLGTPPLKTQNPVEVPFNENLQTKQIRRNEGVIQKWVNYEQYHEEIPIQNSKIAINPGQTQQEVNKLLKNEEPDNRSRILNIVFNINV